MAKQVINVGTSANDKSGDPLRTAFQKVNANFTELYNTAAADVQIPLQTGNNGKYLTTDGVALSWATVSSSGADLGKFIINGGNILATVDDSVPGAFGGYGINLDPGGESSAGISIPSVGNQQSGGTLQIFNTDSSGGQIMMNTHGGMTIASVRGTLGLGLDLETPGVPDHFHVAFETSNSFIPTKDLFFGDDYNYLQLVNSAQGVFIGTNNRSGGDQHQWRFQTDGKFKLPVGGDIVNSNGVSVLGGGASYDQSLNTTDSVSFTGITTGLAQQQGTQYTTVGGTPNPDNAVIFTAPHWMTSIKLIISVEGYVNNDMSYVDHTQTCEATIAAVYNTTTEPVMSVYGLVHTSPTPLATITVQRGTANSIEVIATSTQNNNPLHVKVHAINFVSYFD